MSEGNQSLDQSQLETGGQQRMSVRQLQQVVRIPPAGRKSSSKLSHIAYSGIVNNNTVK